MAIDYVEMMRKDPGSGGDLAAAKSAPVISYEAVKPKRLTKKKNSAHIKQRKTAEKTSMAKGKKSKGKKTKAQKQKANGKKLGRYSKLVASGMSKTDAKNKVWGGAKKAPRKPKKAKKAKKAKTKTVASAPRKASKKPKARKAPKKHGKKSGSKKSRKKSRKTAFVRTTRATVQREAGGGKIVVVQVPARRRSSKKSKTKGKHKKKGGSKKKKSTKARKPKQAAAMENPMTGVELFIGTFTGLLGFATADVVDRIIATHALTGSNGSYTDAPPDAAPASGTKATYGSMFNATAICAPMNLTRWVAGLLISSVPIGVAHFISAPVGRSSLQFFGFGAGMRIVGKGMIDLVALVSKSNVNGMRLYGGEQRAMAIMANDGSVSKLPAMSSTGLGRASLAAPAGHKTGCGCQACGSHVAAAKKPGAGWPSYPPVQQAAPQAPPPALGPPPGGFTATPSPSNTGIRGVPETFIPRYNWGSDKNKAA